MDNELFVLFTALFFIENGLFAIFGIWTLISSARKLRREAREKQQGLQGEEAPQLASVAEELQTMRELMTDLLLEFDRERRKNEAPSELKDE